MRLSPQSGRDKEGHGQCLCLKWNPIPVFNQSVMRHAGRFESNVVAPSFTSSMISVFDFKKEISSIVESRKNDFNKRRLQNGSMIGACEKVYVNWLTRPNQDHTSVIFFGVGKFWIASKIFEVACTIVGDVESCKFYWLFCKFKFYLVKEDSVVCINVLESMPKCIRYVVPEYRIVYALDDADLIDCDVVESSCVGIS